MDTRFAHVCTSHQMINDIIMFLYLFKKQICLNVPIGIQDLLFFGSLIKYSSYILVIFIVSYLNGCVKSHIILIISIADANILQHVLRYRQISLAKHFTPRVINLFELIRFSLNILKVYLEDRCGSKGRNQACDSFTLIKTPIILEMYEILMMNLISMLI